MNFSLGQTGVSFNKLLHGRNAHYIKGFVLRRNDVLLNKLISRDELYFKT
jgi:hypothetical protein